MGDTAIARGTVQGCHRAVELGVHIPGIGSIDDVLQFGLARHQLLHLVGVFVIFRQSEFLIDVVVLLQSIVNALHALHHVLLDRLRLVERRVLRQIAHTVTWAPHHIALILLVETGNNLHEGRFTCTIQTDDAYLGSIEEAEIDVLEHLFLILLDGLAHSHHREYYFLIVNCCHRRGFCILFLQRYENKFKYSYRNDAD